MINLFFQKCFCKRYRSVTVLNKNKGLKVGFKTLDEIKRSVKSDEFWNDRGRFYSALFSAIGATEKVKG